MIAESICDIKNPLSPNNSSLDKKYFIKLILDTILSG